MGMDIGQKQPVPRDPWVILGFRWSKCNQKFEECHDLFRWSKCNQKFEECHDLQRKNENKLYKNEMHKYT